MSASLVGSEMCIRDSSDRGLPPPRTLGRASGDLRRALECCRQPRESSGAVSYTHLTLPTICSV
eukprot:12659737-Alexandrium_andersonii.AAC.1